MLKFRLGRKKQRFLLLFMTLLLAVGIFLSIYSRVQAADTVSSNAFTSSNNNITGSSVVFVSDQTGYSFFRTSTNTTSYSKTTNGGTTWGSPVTVDSQTDTVKVAIWYDRWTPGDTTGNLIYIVDTDTSASDVWYRTLDTSGDTLSGAGTVAITSTPGPVKSNSFGSTGWPSITKGTDVVLYVGVTDNTSSYILKCSTTCTTASNWSDAGTNPLTANDLNWHVLVPLASGVIMAIEHDDAVDDAQYQTWNGTTWSGTWIDIDANCIINTTSGNAAMGVTVDRSGATVYFTEACDTVTLGTDDDIRTYSYSGGTWTTKTDVLTNDARGLVNAKIARDENTGDLYILYLATASGTPTDASTKSVFWKKSTNGMTSWGSESAALAGPDTIDTASLNYTSNERIYAIWGQNNGASADSINGATLADLTPNTAPAAPSFSSPSNGAAVPSTTPSFQMSATDSNSDSIKYDILIYSGTSNNGTSCTGTLNQENDQNSSGTGWDNGTTAYSSGATATYAVQAGSALTRGSSYCYQAKGKDPSGSNTFGSLSSYRTFTVSSIPATPTLIGPSSGATSVSLTPQFTLRTTDTDSDYLQYRVYLYQSDCSTVIGSSPFNQNSSQTGWTGQDTQSNTAYVGSSTLSSSTIAAYTYQATLSTSTTYCWKADAIDPGGSNTFSSTSSTRLFTTASTSSAVQINGGTEINGGTTIQ
jgi:hypothetical protein